MIRTTHTDAQCRARFFCFLHTVSWDEMSWASFSCSYEHMLTVSSVWVFLFYKSPISPEMGSPWAWYRIHGLFCVPTLPVCSARLIYIIFVNEACARDVGYYDVTKQTIITLNNLSAYHGRLVKGLRASTRRNPWKRIFLGMREGVGGKQGGMGRDTIHSCI